jgi:hypothetical protein
MIEIARFKTTESNFDEKLDQLLQHFARRIRETDNLAMVLAFAPQTSRVEVALKRLWLSSVPDRNEPTIKVAHIGPQHIAKTAQVREAEVRRILEMKQAKGCLSYGDNIVKFLRPPENGDLLESLNDSPV